MNKKLYFVIITTDIIYLYNIIYLITTTSAGKISSELIQLYKMHNFSAKIVSFLFFFFFFFSFIQL